MRQKNVNLQVLVLSPQKDTVQGFLSNFRKNGLEIVELPIKKSDTYTVNVSPYISQWLKDSVRQDFVKNINGSYVGCRPINDYILHGKGNSRDALSAQGFWIWNTESIIDMIEWMHTYNKTVPEDKKVKFIGVDTQTNGLDLAFQNINSFLKKTEPHPLLEVTIDSLFQNIKTIKDRSDLSDQRKQLYKVLSYFFVNEMNLIAESSKQEYNKVLSDLRKIIQGVEAGDRKFRNKVKYNVRDEYMAQTILEILQKEGAEAKMMLWAHCSY